MSTVSETLTDAAVAAADPIQTLEWAARRFGDDVFASSSFQTQSMPLLHMISTAVPHMSVVFIDTGFHFPQTLEFRDEVVRRFNLNLVIVSPSWSRDRFLQQNGELYSSAPDACCHMNKVSPMQHYLASKKAWVTGVRKDQTTYRNTLCPIEISTDGVVRIAPLLYWSADEIDRYIERYDLPRHPLGELGYPSIGCAPCTETATPERYTRDGRWPGLAKTECGLHHQWNAKRTT